MLKLKLQYFGYMMQRADSLEKTLILGKVEGRCKRTLFVHPELRTGPGHKTRLLGSCGMNG